VETSPTPSAVFPTFTFELENDNINLGTQDFKCYINIHVIILSPNVADTVSFQAAYKKSSDPDVDASWHRINFGQSPNGEAYTKTSYLEENTRYDVKVCVFEPGAPWSSIKQMNTLKNYSLLAPSGGSWTQTDKGILLEWEDLAAKGYGGINYIVYMTDGRDHRKTYFVVVHTSESAYLYEPNYDDFIWLNVYVSSVYNGLESQKTFIGTIFIP
jgi:hypothetical protein